MGKSGTGTFEYGHDRTIHRTEHLDVETFMGEVVAVWFRCCTLPFQQTAIDVPRRDEMRRGYRENPPRGLTAVVLSQERQAIKAPWTPQQVAALFAWQLRDDVHEFTCPNHGEADHKVERGGVLIPTIKGWICPLCDYTQDWAHDFMIEPQP